MKATTLRTGLVTLLLVLGLATLADAWTRRVWVNGALMTPAQLAVLDRYACVSVPDGSYWLDVSTGVWGYARDPRPVGYLGAACGGGGAGGSGGARPSLSERGMLYSTSPWGRGQ